VSKQYDLGPAATAPVAEIKYDQYRSNIVADHREEAPGPKISRRMGSLSPSSRQEPDTSCRAAARRRSAAPDRGALLVPNTQKDATRVLPS
jgi:hypothetical protein